MYKQTRNIYKIKTTPYNDTEKLENLLNEMSKDGWDLYSMQETEVDDDLFYNCIFIKETENDDLLTDENLFDFKPRIERIINPELDPYDLCLDILRKIKEKRQKISQVKTLIDGTSEDSRSILNDEISRHINELDDLKKHLSKIINPDIMEKKLTESRLTLAISEELSSILDSCSDDNLLSQIVLIRQNLTEDLGYIIPKIKIEIDDGLEENEFSIKIRGISVFNSFAYTNHTMFLENELKLEELPENTIKSKGSKLFDRTELWINDDIAKDYWVKGLNTSEYITSMLEFVLIKNINEIFDYSDLNRYIEIVGNQNLYLVENIIPDYISISELKYILSSLIKEKVSIKDIVYIFEKINDFADEDSKEDILQRLRIALGRRICASLCTGKDNSINAYKLSLETLKIFEVEDLENEEIIRVERSKVKTIIKKIKDKTENMPSDVKELILIVPMRLRHVVYLILSEMIPDIRVIAEEELFADYPVNILGKI